MRYQYIDKNFTDKTLDIIDTANVIIDEYIAKGFQLTLRQLYYQFVARGLIENTERAYKRIGSILTDARMCGMVSWDAIEDRTRYLRGLTHWDNPAEVVRAAVHNFKLDRWETQAECPEVWIEKDALVGVITRVCNRYDVPFFSCRGYVSISEMWNAGQRIVRNGEKGKSTTIYHLGDHDPSGLDMTRDIQDRLDTFSEGAPFEIIRLALNMDQVNQYNPPPNPAKITDSRCASYISQYGTSSWELDALDPQVIQDLIEYNIVGSIDQTCWAEVEQKERQGKDLLVKVATRWDEIADLLTNGKG